MKKYTHTLLLVSAVLLSSCTTTHSGSAPADGACQAGENLIDNPGFVQDQRGRRSPWSASQHAGEPSFEINAIGEGSIEILKTGSQPWFLLSQHIPIDRVRGHTLVYSAELKLNLNDKGLKHAFGAGGGLSVVVHGAPGSGPDHNGILLRERFEHEPHIGQHDWTRVETRFTVPIDANRLRIGIADFANGSMAVRKPRLSICD